MSQPSLRKLLDRLSGESFCLVNFQDEESKDPCEHECCVWKGNRVFTDLSKCRHVHAQERVVTFGNVKIELKNVFAEAVSQKGSFERDVKAKLHSLFPEFLAVEKREVIKK